MIKLKQFGAARKLAKCQGGGTMIEMAIVLPCFMLLLLGLFEFAQVCYGYNAMNYGVREASRYASLHSANSVSPASITAIQNVLIPYATGDGATLNPANCPSCVSVTYSGGGGYGVPGQTVRVAAGLQYCLNLPFYVGTNNCFILVAADTRTVIR
jgi:Flp pilus assembly protein TadG